MIKKFLLSILLIMIFAQVVLAENVFKITSVNFDTSNSLIFLASPDTPGETIMKNVRLITLQNPKRVYFDIDSAVLATKAENWFFNSGGVKQVKISQFSTNPNKLRIVLYLEEDFNQSKISFMKVNNNLVIKLKGDSNGLCQDDYFQNTYRDEKSASSDFYENLSISSEDIDKIKIAVNTGKNEILLSEIQHAFNSSTAPGVNLTSISTKSSEEIRKELKLKSKYYLNLITQKNDGVLISGFGVIGIEKPMYLTNPARVVFDIPNTIVNPDVKFQDYKVGQDTIKVSQYEQNKARIVIMTNEPEKYFPIYSADGQSIFFTNNDKVDLESLFTKTNDASSYYFKKLDSLTSEFIIAFNYPVVHSIRRDSSKLTMNFYNTLRYNDKNFRNTVNNTTLNDMIIDLLPQVGIRLSLPLERNSVVKCYLGADGKSVKILLKGVKPKANICTIERNAALPKCNGKKSIVLDAGHGGGDYGAIRSGINEKDINLDIAKRVQALLFSKGVVVDMTRNEDETISLQDRTAYTAERSPDIFVSVHVNSSSKPEISGIETHYYHQESLELAQYVHSSLISYVRTNDRGLFKSKFYVINHTEVPAILIEVGFLSNENERNELVSEQRKQQTAKAIAEGILKYLNKK